MATPATRIETPRLVLRPWRAEEAEVMRRLWAERDPRVPPHRRIDAAGNPTLDEIRHRVLERRAPLGLPAVEERATGAVIGCCGLVETGTGPAGEPEIVFELLRSAWGRGFATEAGEAVNGWAQEHGLPRLWATVWDWNVASRRVLAKLGFAETGVRRSEPGRGTTIVTVRPLRREP